MFLRYSPATYSNQYKLAILVVYEYLHDQFIEHERAFKPYTKQAMKLKYTIVVVALLALSLLLRIQILCLHKFLT